MIRLGQTRSDFGPKTAQGQRGSACHGATITNNYKKKTKANNYYISTKPTKITKHGRITETGVFTHRETKPKAAMLVSPVSDLSGPGSVVTDFVRLGRAWSDLARHGQIWPNLVRPGQTWPDLVRNCQVGSNWIRLGQGWSVLTRLHQA